MKILIKNGDIVNSSDIFKGDLLIEDEKITGIAEKINVSADEIIDAADKYVIPGGIDVHTHFQLPVKGTVSADGFESGSRAGACGGITTFIDFAHQAKGESLLHAFEMRMKEAKDQSFIDYSFHMGIGGYNDDVLIEMPTLIEKGIPSFKMYMIYEKEGWMSNDAALYAMLQAVRDYGGMVTVHAENPHLIDFFSEKLVEMGKLDVTWAPLARPNFVEAEAIKRILYLTEITDSRVYVVHVSTGEGASLIAEAKGKGIMAFAETCPQYLLLTEEQYQREDGHLFLTSPPLRKEADNTALWKGISMGAVQIAATDTCTFTRQQKDSCKDNFTTLPGGMPGIETLLPLMFSEGVLKGKISLNQWVDLICTNPAKLFGLHPHKGTLSPGTDADVVVFDPEKKTRLTADNLHYNVDYSPYDQITCTGWPSVTICRGSIIYRDGLLTGKKGWGKFIPRFF